jgi:hypothetical protein
VQGAASELGAGAYLRLAVLAAVQGAASELGAGAYLRLAVLAAVRGCPGLASSGADELGVPMWTNAASAA